MLLANGNNVGAMEAITSVLDAGPGLCPSVRVRGLLLAAQVSQSVSVSILTAALSIANYHYLDYLTALVAMHLAQLQVPLILLYFHNFVLLSACQFSNYFNIYTKTYDQTSYFTPACVQ